MTKGQTLISAFGEGMMSHGFTALPNTILNYQEELKLTVREVFLILKAIAFNWNGKGVIRDKDLGKNGKNFRRQRRSLEEKGFLTTKVVRSFKENRFVTRGIEYNFFGLKKRIEELVERDSETNTEPVTVGTKEKASLFEEPKQEETEKPNKKSNSKNKSKKDKNKNTNKPSNKKSSDKSENGNSANKAQSKKTSNDKAGKKDSVIKISESANNKKDTGVSKNKTLSDSEKFLQTYNKLRNETIGGYADYSKRVSYTKHVLDIYQIIKGSGYSCEDVLKTAKDIFTKIKVEKRNEYKLQDTVKLALTKIKENEKHKADIPSGPNALANILDKIKKGSSAKEAYRANDT